MIIDLTSLTKELKIRGIHPGFHFMDNGASTALKLTMTTMNIKYQLVPPSNHIKQMKREQYKNSRTTL